MRMRIIIGGWKASEQVPGLVEFERGAKRFSSFMATSGGECWALKLDQDKRVNRIATR